MEQSFKLQIHLCVHRMYKTHKTLKQMYGKRGYQTPEIIEHSHNKGLNNEGNISVSKYLGIGAKVQHRFFAFYSQVLNINPTLLRNDTVIIIMYL